MLFERHPIYRVSHVLLGFIGVWYPLVAVLAVAYQVIQYVLNVRVFPMEGRIKKGNTVQHTGMKLFEVFVGYTLGIFTKRLAKN